MTPVRSSLLAVQVYMPLHACMLPCCSPFRGSRTFGRHALHKRMQQARKQGRKQHRTCTEAKKKGQQKASKSFGGNQSSMQTGDATMIDYLQFGRAIGDQPKDVENSLRIRNAPVRRDSNAKVYIERWQAEEDPTYALFEAALQGSSYKPTVTSARDAKLQKAKGRAAVNDGLVDFAKATLAAQQGKGKAPQRRSLLKAKTSSPAGIPLAQRPQMPAGFAGSSNGSKGSGDGAGGLVLSRPRSTSQDQVRWLQQPEAGTLAPEDEEEEDVQDYAAFDVGPPELRYEDFEALLRDPTPAEATTASPKKAPIPPSKVNKPRGAFQTAKKAPLSSSPLASSSLDSSMNEPAPQLLRPPRGFQQKAAPSSPRPVKPQEPPPALLGRPAKPAPAPVEPAQAITPVDPAPAPVKQAPAPVKPEQATIPVDQAPAPVEQAPRPVELAPAPVVQARAPVEPKQGQRQPSWSSEEERKPQDEEVLAQAPALPTRSADELQQTQPMLQAPKKKIRPSSKPQPAQSKPAEAEAAVPAQVSRPTLFPPKKRAEAAPEAKAPQATAPRSAPAELPDLLRPAAPRPESLPASVDEEQQKTPTEAQIKVARGKPRDSLKAKRLRQTREQALQDPRAAKAAESATAADLAKPNALPPLELISRPLPKKADEEEPSSPATWGVIDFDKFAAENPKVAASWSKSRWVRAAITENKRLAGLAEVPQLPPPLLADRPARTQLDVATSPEVANTTPAEWTRSVVMKFAVKAQEAHSQFAVPVVSFNSGGVVVRSRYFRGFIPTAYLNSASSFKVLTHEKAIREERGLEAGCTEEESRSMRKQALRTLLGDVLTATIVNVSETHIGNPRIIMTARILRPEPEHAAVQNLPSEALAVLQQNLGEIVEGIVTEVLVWGCFMRFDVDVGNGRRQPVSGLVHNSELTWQYCDDARTIVKAGAPIEAVLIGVDTSSGKVWLSMRQVQPDPLQETLNALLAQGPPAGGAGGSERAELTPATDLNSDPVDFNEDESMMPLQEALDVAEALVLLPEVDSVVPGRRMYTRPTSQDLQVFLSNAAWLDVAASFAQQQDTHLEHPDDELDDREAEDKADANLSSSHHHVEAAAATASGQDADDTHAAAAKAAAHGQVTNGQVSPSAQQVTMQAEQASSLQDFDDESDGADGSGSITLIVRKGQQLQELLVDGVISRDQLKREVEQIVSYLISC